LLAGQYADYLVVQLEQFAAGHRGGSEYAHLMQRVAPRLSRAEMEAVAAYYAQAAGAL
jgi:cytochrome c553